MVFAKLLAELLDMAMNSLGWAKVFTHPFTYAALVSWLLLMGVWLYRLNAALSLYNPLFIIPLLQVNSFVAMSPRHEFSS